MATTATLPGISTRRTANVWFISAALIAGLLLRLRLAWTTFLNPDEALHYFLSRQPSLRFAYEASLTTAHPPLMIIFLHYWSRPGTSELFLRLPFVVAGTVFAGVMFLWLEQVATSTAAWFALALFLFAPPLVSLSAELRQYLFLLLFCACCLYFLERAFANNSAGWIAISGVALYLALLTHYSALVFAAAIGIYALICLFEEKRPATFIAVWVGMQSGVVAICIFLFRSQIAKLRQSSLPNEIASTWLHTSIFHRSEDHVLPFTWTKSLRLFRYLFSHGTTGALALILFLFGVAVLLRGVDGNSSWRKRRGLALLLILPFLITLAAAMAGIYPYGGTRHDVLLAIFAFSGVAVGLDQLPLSRIIASSWIKPALLVLALVICNVFPSPSGPYIRPANQRLELMQQALNSLRSLPANSFIFTDAQGSMVLNYYLCGETMPLPYSEGTDSLLKFPCGNYYVLTSANTQAGFARSTFPALLQKAWDAVPAEPTIYVFQAGWIDDKEGEWLAELRRMGGTPQNFGPNILLCPIRRTLTSAEINR